MQQPRPSFDPRATAANSLPPASPANSLPPGANSLPPSANSSFSGAESIRSTASTSVVHMTPQGQVASPDRASGDAKPSEVQVVVPATDCKNAWRNGLLVGLGITLVVLLAVGGAIIFHSRIYVYQKRRR